MSKQKVKKEFFTISTPNENIFYLIVDRARESENVYFLNEVTEQDLFSLTTTEKPQQETIPEQKEPICNCIQKCDVGMVNVQCEVCSINLKKCIGTVADTEETEKKEQSKTENEKGTILFSIVGIVIVVIAGYYFKVYRPKQEYIDDDDEETEETINEDEQENKETEEIFVNEDDIVEEKKNHSNVEYYDDVPDEYIDE